LRRLLVDVVGVLVAHSLHGYREDCGGIAGTRGDLGSTAHAGAEMQILLRRELDSHQVGLALTDLRFGRDGHLLDRAFPRLVGKCGWNDRGALAHIHTRDVRLVDVDLRVRVVSVGENHEIRAGNTHGAGNRGLTDLDVLHCYLATHRCANLR